MIDDRLLLEEERIRDGQQAVFRPAILTRHRPTVCEGRGQRPCGPRGRGHGALRPAAALEHETAVPTGRRREAHFEHIAVGKAIGAGTLVDDAQHLAMVGERHAVRRCGAARIEFRERDLRRCDRKLREGCEVEARRHWIDRRVCRKARLRPETDEARTGQEMA